MNRNTTRRIRALFAATWALILLAIGLSGCGPSTDVIEVPEPARKSLLQKKVDVQPRPSRTSKSKPGQVTPTGRPAGF